MWGIFNIEHSGFENGFFWMYTDKILDWENFLTVKLSLSYRFPFIFYLRTSSPRVEFHLVNGVEKCKGAKLCSNKSSDASWYSTKPNHLIFAKFCLADSNKRLNKIWIDVCKILRSYFCRHSQKIPHVSQNPTIIPSLFAQFVGPQLKGVFRVLRPEWYFWRKSRCMNPKIV